MYKHLRVLPTLLVTLAITSTVFLNSGCSASGAPRVERDATLRQTSERPAAARDTSSYTSVEFLWSDVSRKRDIPAILYLPISTSGDPNTRRKVPLIVFSHGLGGSRYGYSHFGKYWAAQGFASVHLQHAGSDRAIWTSQGLAVLSALKNAATTDNAIARAQDVSFALNQLEDNSQAKAQLDFDKVAVAGHSFGANTALLSTGAEFEFNQKKLNFLDKRIKAALILSPPALPSSLNAKSVYGNISVPTLHLTGTLDNTPIPGAITTAEMRRESFDAIEKAPKYLGIYAGGKHSMFNDRTRDETSQAIKLSAQTTSLAFFKSVFDEPDKRKEFVSFLKDSSRTRLDKENFFHWESH